MQKGINTIIDETRTEITDWVNNKLNMGLPPTVVGLILDNIMFGLKDITKVVKDKEFEQYNEQLKAETEQIEYKPEDNVNTKAV